MRNAQFDLGRVSISTRKSNFVVLQSSAAFLRVSPLGGWMNEFPKLILQIRDVQYLIHWIRLRSTGLDQDAVLKNLGFTVFVQRGSSRDML